MVVEPRPSETLRARLRAATADDHTRVDELAGRFNLGEHAGYTGFLVAQMRVLPAIEARLMEGPHPPRWEERGRAAALASDLAALGVSSPRPVPILALDTPAERIGAAYVLEGSRLGAAVQSRFVARSQPEAPRAFLDHGAGQSFWPEFLCWLETQPQEISDLAGMIAGSRATFAAFAHAFET